MGYIPEKQHIMLEMEPNNVLSILILLLSGRDTYMVSCDHFSKIQIHHPPMGLNSLESRSCRSIQPNIVIMDYIQELYDCMLSLASKFSVVVVLKLKIQLTDNCSVIDSYCRRNFHRWQIPCELLKNKR